MLVCHFIILKTMKYYALNKRRNLEDLVYFIILNAHKIAHKIALKCNNNLRLLSKKRK